MIRIRILITIAIAMLAVSLSPAASGATTATPTTTTPTTTTPTTATPTTTTPPAEPSVTFSGGGWGHGIGMSQYGALGRAYAEQKAEQIIAFYYQGTQILHASGLALDPAVVVDDVDVLVGTANCSSFRPSGQVTIAIDGTDIGTTTDPMAISRNGPGSSGNYWWEVLTGPGARCNGSASNPSITADPGAVDLCPTGCASQPWPAPAWLDIRFTDGEPLSVSAAWKRSGEADRAYAHGQITLVPQGRPTSAHSGESEVTTQCLGGGSNSFCVVVGNMTMQQYLYGLAEVPSTWHIEAMRTQAIAGRSYALSRIESRTRPTWYEPFDLWSSTKDQYYVGFNHESELCPTGASCRWLEAVDLTNDMFVAAPDGTIATTFYSSSNGGYTAANEDVWGNIPFSYLRANPDPYDDIPANPNGKWEFTYTLNDIGRWLANYPYADLESKAGFSFYNASSGRGHIDRIVISGVPPSGRIDKALVTLYSGADTYEVRDSSGNPYGYRFFRAIQLGCRGDSSCSEPLTTKIRISSFFDVPKGKWFTDPIQWISDSNIATGTAPNLYSPLEPNSRASVAAFLWRFAGKPAAALPGPFTDVIAGSDYEEAVAWLLNAEITTGTSPTEFSPDLTVTRGQAATFLWRFAGQPTPSVDQTFADVDPAKYYAIPISWMVEWGITTGTTPQTFAPESPVNRAEMATFLWRLAGKPEAFGAGTAPPSAMRLP